MSRKVLAKAIMLYLVFNCDFTSSKKLRLPGLGSSRTDKILNECGRCKVLTDSFLHWLEKTSRGKFDGGDAAWEEAKLKSYARSEIRLVEIQESLCSELYKYQDYCYVLSEEADQLLEKWWFNEGSNSADLHTWLCIETLKYCCPTNHFGDSCTPCPLDENNKICSGHGKCDGDGTRKGNGTCICNRGYTGKNCEDCAENFYLDQDKSCKQCHQTCNSCFDEGDYSCISCKSGWQLELYSCVDIDECQSSSSCKTNEYCINIEGSFKCKACDTSCNTCAGLGEKNCTSCKPFRVHWGGMCISKSQHYDILYDTAKKLSVYLALAIVLAFVTSKIKLAAIGPIFVLVIAVVMYYIESVAKTSTLDVLLTICKDIDPFRLVKLIAKKYS